jgi:hypothetical protein
MNEFPEILAAAAAAIGPGFFQLPVHGADPAHRERVYCYELYHQLRVRWPHGAQHVLNGEVDKRGHPQLWVRPGMGPVVPDLLVHVPGTMQHNYAIVEVKPFPTRRRGIAKDLTTLTTFMLEWRYRRGIFLAYGGDPGACRDAVRNAARTVARLAPVEVWHHPVSGAPAVRLDMLRGAAAAA